MSQEAGDPKYWERRWREGRIGFHRGAVNQDLVRHAEAWLGEAASEGGGCRILVPLCGKSLDLVYLASEGHEVVGVEVSEEAVVAFHDENSISPEIVDRPPFREYVSQVVSTRMGLTLRVGDFFDLDPARDRFDAIYDRAALIALPPDLRRSYAQRLIDLLRPGGRLLLVGCRYRAEDMTGPPFSVEDEELVGHFASAGRWEKVEERDGGLDYPKLAERGLRELRSDVLFQKPTEG